MNDITRILSAIGQDEPQASEKLLPLVYDELRKLAAQKLLYEKPGQTLQPTALVHDAYLRLVDVETAQRWDSRGHFFAAAGEAMRRILVEGTRRRQSLKRGGGAERIEISDLAAPILSERYDLLALDEALSQLESEHPDRAKLVKLRFFAGCSLEQAAECLGISRATAQRHWAFARAWLYGKINQD